MLTKTRAKPVLIGELSERTGVNTETIRYYERIGLLSPPPRSAGRHRLYSEDHVQRLSFIRRSRELGFTLDDIRALAALVDQGGFDCGIARDIAIRHLSDVRGKIASLRRLERALKSMADACHPGDQSSCPIITALSSGPSPSSK
jgi:MerR family mercuric resistance operon transcriptional regulator